MSSKPLVGAVPDHVGSGHASPLSMCRALSRRTGIHFGGACSEKIEGFLTDRRGVAAVEFGLILPIMALLLAGSIELSRAIDNYRKVTQLARTISDLTAQDESTDNLRKTAMTQAAMTDIVASSSLLLLPFSGASAQIRVSSMGVYLTTLGNKPYVCSSSATGATARTPQKAADDLTVPMPFRAAGMRYILTEVTMDYTPLLGSMFSTFLGKNLGITFSSSMPWPVRGGDIHNGTSAEIILPNGQACPAVAS